MVDPAPFERVEQRQEPQRVFEQKGEVSHRSRISLPP
jgi:hypothetical protein